MFEISQLIDIHIAEINREMRRKNGNDVTLTLDSSSTNSMGQNQYKMQPISKNSK